MSETAPTQAPEAPKSAEHAELARLEAQYEKKKFEVGQNEAFGKYDVVEGPLNKDGRAIPNSHAEYHAQRPSDGIVRDGDTFRQAESGQFASADEYAVQGGSTPDHYDEQGSAQRHYDELMGIENTEIDTPDFENMGVMQLAKEQAKAEAVNDIAGVNEIRAIFDQHMLELAATEGSGITDADLDKESARYQSLVDKFKGNGGADSEDDPEPGSEPEPSAEPTEEDSPVIDPEKEAEKGTEKKSTHKAGENAELNGEKVSIEKTFLGTDGVVFEVVNADGTTSLVHEKDLTFVEVAEQKPSLVERATDIKDNVVERAKNAKEQAKKWWTENGSSIKEKFTFAYIGALVTSGLTVIKNETIDRGVDPFEPFEDQEKKRARNRVILIAGVVGLAVVSYVVHNHDHIGQLLDGNSLDTSGGGLPDGALTPDSGAPTPGETEVPTLTPIDQQLPTVDVAPDPGFNIGNGEGGEQLFNTLGIDPSKWYQNQDSFLTNFPDDFYRMPGGGVGIAHQGVLSQGAQDAINGLR